MNDANASGNHWEIVLDGAPSDLDQWKWAFEAGDTWVEPRAIDGKNYVLRSKQLAGCTTALEARDTSKKIIEYLNGIMRAEADTELVHQFAVVEVSPDDRLHRTIIPETARFRATFFPATITASAAAAPAPGQTRPQRVLARAATDRILRDLLLHYGKDPNWIDLFKTYEAWARLTRGLSRQSWKPSNNQLEKFNRTADYYYRHAFDPNKQAPPRPMTLEDAAQMIDNMVKSALNAIEPK